MYSELSLLIQVGHDDQINNQKKKDAQLGGITFMW